jgi:Protein of unknown function (DUF3800)
MDLFMDEAGYTGPDLVNRDQPVFVLASTVLTDGEAQDLVTACFPSQEPGRELKHSRLSRTKKWRAEVVEFFRQVPNDQVAFFGVHKEFALLAFLIDFWLEPLAYRDGVNLYARGANIALSNVSFITLGATLGLEGRRELLRQFQVMTRDRTPFAYESFWDSFRDATRRHDLIQKAIGGLLAAEMELGWPHLHKLPADLLDLGDYGLLDTIQFWRKKYSDSQFDLIHDHSKMIERNRQRWEAVLDPSNPAATVGQDRRTIEFPLPVRGLQLEDSETFLQLQIADIVAGAACTVLNAKARNASSDYTDRLLDVGILNSIAGGIWPSDAISPEELETVGPVLRDPAEFIGEIVAQHKKQQPAS